MRIGVELGVEDVGVEDRGGGKAGRWDGGRG